MRDLERGRHVLCQPVVGHLGAVVDPRTFGGETPPIDAVEMQDRGVRGKARPDGRARVVFRPVDDVDEVLPERLLLQRCGVRLGAGHDQPVDVEAGKVGDVGILLVEAPLRRLRAVNRWQREAAETDLIVGGGRLQQAHELTLGRLQRRVRHIVDEPDRENRIGIAPAVKFLGLARLDGRKAGTDDEPVFVEQQGHAWPGRSIPRPRAADAGRLRSRAPGQDLL